MVIDPVAVSVPHREWHAASFRVRWWRARRCWSVRAIRGHRQASSCQVTRVESSVGGAVAGGVGLGHRAVGRSLPERVQDSPSVPDSPIATPVRPRPSEIADGIPIHTRYRYHIATGRRQPIEVFIQPEVLKKFADVDPGRNQRVARLPDGSRSSVISMTGRRSSMVARCCPRRRAARSPPAAPCTRAPRAGRRSPDRLPGRGRRTPGRSGHPPR